MANESILIVEDDGPVATLLERYLKRSGYAISAIVATGADALRQADRLRPDLVLMDIELPGGMDGVETARRLHDGFDIPVVFLTGMADDVTLSRIQRSDAYGYQLKPFRPEELRASIELAFKQHRGDRQFKKIESWFSAAIKAIGDAVITTDLAETITFANPVAEALTGWKKSQAVGRSLGEVFVVMDTPVRTDTKPAVAPRARKRISAGLPRQTRLVAQDGGQIPIETNVSPIRDDQQKIIGSVLIFRDISERHQVEAELKRSREQFRGLATHLQTVREEERTRIAREIHDEFGQLVTGLKLDLAWLERRLPAGKTARAGAALREKTRSMAELLNQIVQSVRKISAELRPGVLDNLGLAAAVEWQAHEFKTRTGIPCVVEADVADMEFDGAFSTAVFRIFQEALTNVARHAHATQVRVRLKADSRCLRLEVRDNGRGITDAATTQSGSFGLLGMRERVMLFGGEFAIHGRPGQGTALSVEFPLPGATKPIPTS